MELNEEKQLIYDKVVKEGKSCFITGEAGTGKSYLVNHLIEGLYQKYGKNSNSVFLCATTGIAAVNIGGTTLNSAFSFFMPAVGNLNYPSSWTDDKKNTMENLSVLIVDEVSMLRCDTLDFIDELLVYNIGRGLNSIQLILIGDMKQLPPVVKQEDISELLDQYPQCRDNTGGKNHKFGWHKSHFYARNKSKFEIFSLKEVFRQRDADFIEALNAIRNSKKTNYFRNYVKEPKGVFLASTNNTVSEFNKTELAKIKSKEFVYEASIEGNYNPNDFLFEKTLIVKDGCKVMYLSNSQGLYNGMCGELKIKAPQNNSQGAKASLFFVQSNGTETLLQVEEKQKVKYNDKGELVGDSKISQYPIKLAYAITIHKSQGLSLDEVTVDERKMFASGMFYVALSRAKNPEKLYLYNG